jgi:basic membrane protein A
MKKLLAMLFLAVAALVFVSCDKEEAEIALVTDVGTIDDESFNQASWQGVKKYAEEKGKTYRYYQPKKDSNEARLASIRPGLTGRLISNTREPGKLRYPMAGHAPCG